MTKYNFTHIMHPTNTSLRNSVLTNLPIANASRIKFYHYNTVTLIIIIKFTTNIHINKKYISEHKTEHGANYLPQILSYSLPGMCSDKYRKQLHKNCWWNMKHWTTKLANAPNCREYYNGNIHINIGSRKRLPFLVSHT